MENTTIENQSPSQETIYLKIIKRKRPIIISGVIVIIALALFFFKGHFIAATVNGSPISRFSVIKELEKLGGKQALESLISKKLIETELNKKGISVAQTEISVDIVKIEAQVANRGGTLKDALVAQGMTEEQLREQITVQKKLEKLLADKIQVRDEEVNQYIKDNKITIQKGEEINTKNQIQEQLRGQKLNQEAQQWISTLRTEAKIKYYVDY